MSTITITITVHEDHHFTIIEGERVANMLAWDEMLGEIAALTHPKLGAGRYSVHIDTHIGRMEYHAKCRRGRATPNYQDPDFKETE
jgi:hypothetical protein